MFPHFHFYNVTTGCDDCADQLCSVSRGVIYTRVCMFQVTLLLLCFSDAELADQSTDKQRLVDFINMYNRRFSGQPLTVRR